MERENAMRSMMLVPAILAAVFLAAAFHQWCYVPQRAELAGLAGELEEQRQAAAAVQGFMNMHADEKERSAALSERSAALEKRLPKSMGQGAFLALLEREALHEKLTLAAVVPGPLEEEGGTSRLPLDVELDGDYFHLLAFLKGLERSERFVRVESTEIHSDDGRLHVKLKLSIFAEKE
ncbi:type 4a pilus biogenesis protein PilO [uncultured Selenomonas sp.]|uniref:type 4a pilus biogenesis protein PilO n=1 Tax=uncultured Selenomonas sp. TaxID=159275 RepID=UPI0028DCF80D|nr:type 4a pilus biogenesis protein PilO [uncultured Selenomonas sp.]